MTVADYITEAASKCDDLDFQDFQVHEYKQELYRAVRKLVKEYNIATRVVSLQVEEASGEITLALPFFYEEDRVFVEGKEFHIKDVIDEEKDEDVYYIRTVNGKLVFDFYPRSENASVAIYYKVRPNAETIDDERKLDILPEVPSVYEESLLKQMLYGIASIGLARFKEDKLYKYQRILKLNADRLNPTEEVKSEWVKIKPYTLL